MAKNSVTSLVIDSRDLLKGAKRYGRETAKSISLAMEKAGIQLLTWVINGSPNETKTPPLLTGFLRGSGTAVVNNKVVFTGGSLGFTGDSFSGKNTSDNEILIVFNTPYAERMETGDYKLGKRSARIGNAGKNFIASHIEGDAVSLTNFMAKDIKRRNGTL